MKIAGTYDETDFCVISDHGQIDIKRVVSLNTVFRREGLLKLDPDGNLLSWDAYMRSGGTSAWVYIKDKSDKALYDRVYGLLKSLRDDGVYGIGRVYTEEEAEKEERLSEDFSFVVETDGYTSFSERMDGPAAQSFDLSDYRFGRATHGHNPDKALSRYSSEKARRSRKRVGRAQADVDEAGIRKVSTHSPASTEWRGRAAEIKIGNNFCNGCPDISILLKIIHEMLDKSEQP